MPEGVKVAKVNYDNEQSVVSALEGQQFLIITMRTTAPQDSQAKLIAAAAKAGVPYVMPNGFGIDFVNDGMSAGTMSGPAIRKSIKDVEEHGVSDWVVMVCSFWYEFSIALGPNWFGFDFPNKTVTFYDDGNTRINTSTWNQCGRAIGNFLSLPELPQDENDTSPTISQWKNKPLYTSSFLISQREILDSINRVTGQTDADWTIEYEPSQARYNRGKELMETDHLNGFITCLYSRTFFPNGGGNVEDNYGLANDALGLPKEDFDEATKRAVAMVEEGYNPFTRP